jgi:hypothetical protein
MLESATMTGKEVEMVFTEALNAFRATVENGAAKNDVATVEIDIPSFVTLPTPLFDAAALEHALAQEGV